MYFNYKGIKLYYEKYENQNNKKNIVILPGFGDTRKTFNNLIYHLQDNFNIYIVKHILLFYSIKIRSFLCAHLPNTLLLLTFLSPTHLPLYLQLLGIMK